MDQISAHLDRGWDLVQRGDAEGAEASARRALELNTQSAEAYHLLGYVSALQGEFAEAVESYRQALALDDTYLEALLNAAEVYVHPLGEFDAALGLLDQALNLDLDEEERLDVLLIRFDALLGKGELELAAELTQHFPTTPLEDPYHTFLIGRAFYEIGDLDAAEALIEHAALQNPENPEAFYYLGLLYDDREDVKSATNAFLKARALDLEFPPPSWSLSPSAFELAAKRALSQLPRELSSFVQEGELYAAEAPGVEVVVEGLDPRALVMVDPMQPEASLLPRARVFVYQRNVERLSGSLDMVEGEIRNALRRELTGMFVDDASATEPQKMLN